MEVELKRNAKEIYAVLDKAAVSISKGSSKFPGMSYEDGINEALNWVIGNTDDDPMPDE